MTLYPNLAEEMKFYENNFYSCASAANIHTEVLRAVLNKGEELTDRELCGLAQYMKCSYMYLKNPRLSYFGKSKKDKERYAEFLEKAEKLTEKRNYAVEKGIQFQYPGTVALHYQTVMDFCMLMNKRGYVTYSIHRNAEKAFNWVRADIEAAIHATVQEPRRNLVKKAGV